MQKGDLDARRGGVPRAAVAPGQRRGLLQPRAGPQAEGRLRRGEAALRRAVALDPRCRRRTTRWVSSCGRPGRADEAAALSQRRRREAAYAEAHYMLGTASGQQGRLAEAVAEFRETIRPSPVRRGPPEPRPGPAAEGDPRGRAAASPRRSASAEEGGRPGGASRPSAGRGKPIAGRPRGALESFREAVRLAPENADAHFQLALALAQAGARVPSPARHFEEARRLAPYLYRARTTGGEVRARRGRAPRDRAAASWVARRRLWGRKRPGPSASPSPTSRAQGRLERGHGLRREARRTNTCWRPRAAAPLSSITTTTDGRDVFLVNGTTLEGFPKGQEPTNHLYRNRGDGTFEDTTRKGGPGSRAAGGRASARGTTTTTGARTCS